MMKLLMLRRHPQLSVVPYSLVSGLHMEYVEHLTRSLLAHDMRERNSVICYYLTKKSTVYNPYTSSSFRALLSTCCIF